ncbi:IclR family transcriptional regulator [Phyllobacterium zundukense]|uniref:Transcriptional regulator n=1 Tax=Phyllobacterium zundukense TaxID=1867719 RepID=A0A2N9W0M7_9HYPH|nr:IclR family transcriptional regulator C-terminal domain-containing protein [Phyllobacterium zundukense]ATU95458.1 transcriptional regulator [Phyllobacterium zundukense]PIO45295.1 transcriptional regulator [Phyllobacterium zundukense]
MSNPTKLLKSTEKPLERYVRILEIIAGFPDGVSPITVSEMLGLPKASAYRLIRSLTEVQLVELSAPPTATCRIGKRLEQLLFANADDDWFKVVAHPILQELAQSVGKACFVARFQGNIVRSLDMVAPDNLLRAYIIPGQAIPLHAGASAKAILAYQDPSLIEDLLDRPLERYTPDTKTDFVALREELNEVRSVGIAYCVGEDVEGFSALAAPVVVEGHPVQHSVCITGTTTGIIETNRDANILAVKHAAREMAELLKEKFKGSFRQAS